MSRRILVNLVAFAALGGVLAVWAVRNVVELDFIEQPYEITADFESSPGLSPNFEVAYLGSRIGTISDVDLRDGHVRVRMEIERGREIPEGVHAAVRRKSAIGEPYVDLSLPDATSAGDDVMTDGDHIDIERTQVPLAYADLFAALDDLISGVPPEDLRTVVHELAVGVEGRAGDLRRIVVDVDDALETFAADAELLDEFARNLTALTNTIADHRDSLGSTVDDLAPLAETLAAAKDDLDRVLAEGPVFMERFATLVADSKGPLSCTLGSLGTVSASLGSEELRTSLARVIELGPAVRDMFRAIVDQEADGGWIRTFDPINAGGGEPLPQYPEPRTLPEPPEIEPCPDLPGRTGASGEDPADTDTDDEASGPRTPGEDDGRDEAAPSAPAGSDKDAGDDGWSPFWLIAALALAGIVAGMRPWRWIAGGSGAAAGAGGEVLDVEPTDQPDVEELP